MDEEGLGSADFLDDTRGGGTGVGRLGDQTASVCVVKLVAFNKVS